MVEIKHEGKTYKFKERLTINDWYNLPVGNASETKNPKFSQLQMILAISEDGLEMTQLKQLDFVFMSKVLKACPKVFEMGE